jgi:hypothetical protein
MPDLESRIAEWRRQMIAGGITDPEALDELESHLREDVERNVQSGLNAQQAFDAAVAKIGDAHALKFEFGNSGTTKPSDHWPWVVRIGLFIGAILYLVKDLSRLERLLALGLVWAVMFVLSRAVLRFRRRLAPEPRAKPVAVIFKFAPVLVVVWWLIAVGNAANVISVHLSPTAERFLTNIVICAACVVLVFALFRERRRVSFELLTATPWSFTARQSLTIARSEASGLYHDFIGTEHLLLGLLKSESVVPGILKKLGVNDNDVRSEIQKLVGIGPAHEVSAEIPLTPRAREALQLATKEAKTRRQLAPGPEHIFLGLLRENSGVAAVVLKKLGVRFEKAREIISRELL